MLRPPEARSMSWSLDDRRCRGGVLSGIGLQAAHVLQEPCQSGILYLCHCRRGAADHLLLESAVQPEAALLGAGVALLVPPPVRLYREIKPGQEKSKAWCQAARPRHSCSYCHTYSTCLTLSPRWHKDDEEMAVLPSSLVSSYFLHITSNNQAGKVVSGSRVHHCSSSYKDQLSEVIGDCIFKVVGRM